MSFLNATFMWSILAVLIPIIIALWNRKKYRKESFGGFYLLKKILESNTRRIRIFELLKLINRIILIVILGLIFSDPTKTMPRISGAEDGFAIILDVSRSMQESNLIQDQIQELKEILNKMPSSSRGVLMLASDECRFLNSKDDQQTANPNVWMEDFSDLQIGYTNSHLTTTALSSCLGLIQNLFGKEVLTILISPLPKTFDEALLDKFQVELLKTEIIAERQSIELTQEVGESSVQFLFQNDRINANLIDSQGRVEALGAVSSPLDIFSERLNWLWVKGDSKVDPWINQKLYAIKNLGEREVTLWAESETDAFISLLTALRAHPRIRVIKQVGGEPIGENVIIYGGSSADMPDARRIWYFLGQHTTGPFSGRDVKRWTSGGVSGDVRKSFQKLSDSGPIFVKQYHLLKLDGLDVVETFEDGAPFLLETRDASRRVWISPFDLEDMTTDFTLEPTFIPYLYSRLDSWLAGEKSINDQANVELVWGLPARSQPTPMVISQKKWPGLYRSQDQFEMIPPIELPEVYRNYEPKSWNEKIIDEDVSLRPILYKAAVVSVFLELLLCLMSIKSLFSFFIFMLFTSSFELSANQKTRIGILDSMEKNRQTALEQLVQSVEAQSNLDFGKPEKLKPKEFWKVPVVFFSSDSDWRGFEESDRDIVRDYLDRGGMIVFDDALAVKNSSFFRSVQKEMGRIFPGRSFQEVPKDDVIFRSFYLLNEVSGRKLTSPRLEGISIDNRWAVIFSFNDLLGANLRSASGDFIFSVSPYGMMQRVLSQRLLLNILMYSVTLHYKDDAIHLPHILKRRVK